jgi:hypothetical protein
VNVPIDKIFPIVDDSSAQLMAVKARCLFVAGVITEAQKQAIEDRAAEKLRSTAQIGPRPAPSFQPTG